MDAHGIEVLDGADDDDVVGEVAHDLQLELLPAGDAPLDEDTADGARVEAVDDGTPKVLLIVSRRAALAAQRKTGTNYQGEAYLAGEFERVLDTVYDAALGDSESESLHRLTKEVAIFGFAD